MLESGISEVEPAWDKKMKYRTVGNPLKEIKLFPASMTVF